MRNRKSSKAVFFLPLVLLSAAVVTPAYANWFSSSGTVSRNVGSAPNPRPQDIRAYRMPQAVYPPASQAINEQGKVKLKISLTEQGTISSVVVESSSGFPR